MTVLWNVIRSNVIAPASTRLGTLVAGTLVPLGANADHAAQVGIGVTALGLIMFDLTVAYIRKRYIERNALAKVGLATTKRYPGNPSLGS